MNKKISIIAAAIVFGILIYIGPSITLSLLVLAGIYLFVKTRPPVEKESLSKIVITALLLRLIFFVVAMFITYCGLLLDVHSASNLQQMLFHVTQLVRDLTREISNGYKIDEYLRNIRPTLSGIYYLHAGAWIQGGLNFLFGRSLFNLLVFPLIDIWSLIIVYYIGNMLFGRKVAVLASWIYAIMPSIIYISCTNIRFMFGMLSFLLLNFFLLKFSRRNNTRDFVMLSCSVLLFMTFRDKAVKPLLMVLPFLLFISLGISFRKKLFFIVLGAILATGLFLKSESVKNNAHLLVADIISSHRGFTDGLTSGEFYSNYRIYDSYLYTADVKTYPKGQLFKAIPRALPKGVFYFMGSPFPWNINNITRFYYYPQILLWYSILIFAFLGIMKAVLLRVKHIWPLIFLCFFYISILSLVIGNEGIAARYRELTSPIFYIFASFFIIGFISSPQEDSG